MAVDLNGIAFALDRLRAVAEVREDAALMTSVASVEAWLVGDTRAPLEAEETVLVALFAIHEPAGRSADDEAEEFAGYLRRGLEPPRWENRPVERRDDAGREWSIDDVIRSMALVEIFVSVDAQRELGLQGREVAA